jgi:hypothetical protein
MPRHKGARRRVGQRDACSLQLSHKDDEHAERTIVCSRNNTAVFTPYTPGEDLELDMGVVQAMHLY